MNIKVLTGHLTQTEKNAIKAILKANLTRGRVGRKDYIITQKGDVYSVSVFQKDRGMMPDAYSKIRVSKYKSTFILK